MANRISLMCKTGAQNHDIPSIKSEKLHNTTKWKLKDAVCKCCDFTPLCSVCMVALKGQTTFSLIRGWRLTGVVSYYYH